MYKIPVFSLLFSLAFFSCVNPDSIENPVKPVSSKRLEPVAAQKPNTVANSQPGVTNFAKAPVTIYPGNYYYQCSYGGFLFNFGYSFPHPNSVAANQTGTPFIPSLGAISGSPNPLGEFRMAADGSSFTAVFCTLQGTVPVNAHASLSAYYQI